jgi:hypothetical protein
MAAVPDTSEPGRPTRTAPGFCTVRRSTMKHPNMMRVCQQARFLWILLRTWTEGRAAGNWQISYGEIEDATGWRERYIRDLLYELQEAGLLLVETRGYRDERGLPCRGNNIFTTIPPERAQPKLFQRPARQRRNAKPAPECRIPEPAPTCNDHRNPGAGSPGTGVPEQEDRQSTNKEDSEGVPGTRVPDPSSPPRPGLDGRLVREADAYLRRMVATLKAPAAEYGCPGYLADPDMAQVGHETCRRCNMDHADHVAPDPTDILHAAMRREPSVLDHWGRAALARALVARAAGKAKVALADALEHAAAALLVERRLARMGEP